jgi:hypothetical protein
MFCFSLQVSSLLGSSGTESTITEAITGLFYQPWMIDDDERGAVSPMIGRGKGSTRIQPATVSLCPPQIPHERPGPELGLQRSCGKPATGRLSYGEDFSILAECWSHAKFLAGTKYTTDLLRGFPPCQPAVSVFRQLLQCFSVQIISHERNQ